VGSGWSKNQPDKKSGDTVKNLIMIHVVAAGLLFALGTGVQGQVINPTPFFTSFADTNVASTYNGEPLVVGTIIQAYDPSGIYCGKDTVTTEGTFGYFSVYGDDPESIGVDEGAESGEQITFKINGVTATVVSGDDTWTNGDLKSVTLSAAPSATIAISAISLPSSRAGQPEDTLQFKVDVRNDGDGLDFYGVRLSMSVDDDTVSNPGIYNWEALEPDSVVYADPDDTVSVYFSIRLPKLNSDTANMIYYSVFSHLDTTVSVDDSVKVFMSVTDVDDPSIILPHGFALHQNYPNPFNPTTTISFVLPARSETRLEIFNILGRSVDTRNLGVLSGGPHEIEYDASAQASGVYFYRVVTEHASESKKMILLK